MKRMYAALLLLAVFFGTAPAYAEDPKSATTVTATTEEAVKAVESPKESDAISTPDISKIEKEDPTTFTDSIKTAYAAKEWGVLVGFILMLVVFLIVKFLWKTLPVAWIPYMSIAFGVLGDVGWQLAIGGQVWWRAILAGLTSGATATGMWELLGKKIFGSVTDMRGAAAAAKK